jgi:hypothetical protein
LNKDPAINHTNVRAKDWLDCEQRRVRSHQPWLKHLKIYFAFIIRSLKASRALLASG